MPRPDRRVQVHGADLEAPDASPTAPTSGWGCRELDRPAERPRPAAGARGPEEGRRAPVDPRRPLPVVFLAPPRRSPSAAYIRLPYAVMSPGPISNVLGDTHSDGKTATHRRSAATTYPTTGSLDFTTVRINGGPGYPVNVWAVIGAWIDPRQDVYPVDVIFPPQQTAEQVAAGEPGRDGRLPAGGHRGRAAGGRDPGRPRRSASRRSPPTPRRATCSSRATSSSPSAVPR